MTTVRAQNFGFSQLGSAAAETLDHKHLSRSTLIPTHEDFAEASTTLHWGDCLRPHHFKFEEGTAVRPRLTTRPDITCYAVSVLGAGQFREFDNSVPVPFDNGGIIVKAGDRCKLVSFETFRKHFVSREGEDFSHIMQIDFQTPRK
jgi:hypothetical protein